MTRFKAEMGQEGESREVSQEELTTKTLPETKLAAYLHSTEKFYSSSKRAKILSLNKSILGNCLLKIKIQ